MAFVKFKNVEQDRITIKIMKITIDTNTAIAISICYLITTAAFYLIKGFIEEHFHQNKLAKRRALELELIKILKSGADSDTKLSAIRSTQKQKENL